MSETERLALIARAGKHLRNLRDEVPSPEHDVRRGAIELEQTPDRQHRAVHGLLPLAPLHEPPSTRVATPPEVSPSVRLNFAQLRGRGMLTPDNLKSNLGSEYHAIKRRILAGLRGPRTGNGASNLVMVTSARSAEGKTFTCVNLAISLAAERNIRVLLVDGDILHPQLSMIFEPSGAPGITDLLDGNDYDIDAVAQRCSDLPNLNIVLSGRRGEHSAE